jgi:hypothetical protein
MQARVLQQTEAERQRLAYAHAQQHQQQHYATSSMSHGTSHHQHQQPAASLSKFEQMQQRLLAEQAIAASRDASAQPVPPVLLAQQTSTQLTQDSALNQLLVSVVCLHAYSCLTMYVSR